MLMRFDPFRDVDRLTEQLDQLWGGRTSPAIPMDAVRHGNQVFISFDLPGVDRDAIELTVERNVLTVRAERRFEPAEGDEVIANERRQGHFARQVFLGETLDTQRLEANYDHGVLTVVLPVAEAAQPRKVAIGGSTSHADAIEAESVAS
jgi:HSP20 family protein